MGVKETPFQKAEARVRVEDMIVQLQEKLNSNPEFQRIMALPEDEKLGAFRQIITKQLESAGIRTNMTVVEKAAYALKEHSAELLSYGGKAGGSGNTMLVGKFTSEMATDPSIGSGLKLLGAGTILATQFGIEGVGGEIARENARKPAEGLKGKITSGTVFLAATVSFIAANGLLAAGHALKGEWPQAQSRVGAMAGHTSLKVPALLSRGKKEEATREELENANALAKAIEKLCPIFGVAMLCYPAGTYMAKALETGDVMLGVASALIGGGYVGYVAGGTSSLFSPAKPPFEEQLKLARLLHEMYPEAADQKNTAQVLNDVAEMAASLSFDPKARGAVVRALAREKFTDKQPIYVDAKGVLLPLPGESHDGLSREQAEFMCRCERMGVHEASQKYGHTHLTFHEHVPALMKETLKTMHQWLQRGLQREGLTKKHMVELSDSVKEDIGLKAKKPEAMKSEPVVAVEDLKDRPETAGEDMIPTKVSHDVVFRSEKVLEAFMVLYDLQKSYGAYGVPPKEDVDAVLSTLKSRSVLQELAALNAAAAKKEGFAL